MHHQKVIGYGVLGLSYSARTLTWQEDSKRKVTSITNLQYSCSDIIIIVVSPCCWLYLIPSTRSPIPFCQQWSDLWTCMFGTLCRC